LEFEGVAMTADFDPASTRGAMNIVRQWLGDGFAGQDGVVQVRTDADPEACKEALIRLCRHLSSGALSAAGEEGLDLGSVFEVIPRSG
jgi:hypothetical protein